MEKLKALISEALQKFPSEDIRELVARETGFTLEEVSERMDENAKAYTDDFPAVSFALLKKERVYISADNLYVGDVDGDSLYNTENDKAILSKVLTDQLDPNEDNKITFKIGFLPNTTNMPKNLPFKEFKYAPDQITYEERTEKIGITVQDLLKEPKYKDTTNVYMWTDGDSYGYTTKSVDLSKVNLISDLSSIMWDHYFDDHLPVFISDGTTIFFFKGAKEESTTQE